MAGARSQKYPSEQAGDGREGGVEPKERSGNASSLGLCNRSELHGVTDGRRPLLSLRGGKSQQMVQHLGGRRSQAVDWPR